MFLQVNIVFASMFIGLAYGYGNTTVWDGYPAGFICQEAVNELPNPSPPCFPIPSPGQPPNTEYVNCTISKNNEVKFNKTILWGNRMEGYFEDVDESWEKANWLIEASWSGGSLSYTVVTTIKTRTELNCSETVHESWRDRVDEFTLDCTAPDYLEFMTKDQYDLVNTTWYKDCEEISRDDEYFKFLEGDFDGRRCGNDKNTFKKLQFINASYEKTPGTYHCELEYKGNILPASSYHLCLTEKYRSANIPTIVRSKNEYIVHPGDDVDVYCSGNTGGREDSNTIIWKRNETELCRSSMNEKTESCSSNEYVIQEQCFKLTPEEAEAAKIQHLSDNFTAMYTFRNVDYSDSGFYNCNLHTPSGQKTEQFQIIVRDKENRHIALIATFVSLGVCFLLALILGFLYFEYRVEVRYFWKKHFGKVKETHKHLAYLVYMPDAFDGNNNNAVDVVMKHFDESRVTCYDPNRSHNEISATVGNNFQATLGNCLRMVVIVTPELIQQNDIEIFRTYEGLHESVKKDLRIIFVCSKDMKKELDEDENPAATTIKKFMKKQGNTSIVWTKNKTKRVGKALYVALPNVEPAEERNGFGEMGYDNAIV